MLSLMLSLMSYVLYRYMLNLRARPDEERSKTNNPFIFSCTPFLFRG